jgi:4-amino-4-deoxy-L-arabinose transferase-like glycosyltransferase
MSRKNACFVLAAFLLAILLSLRLLHITADPPYDLSTSGGPYGDPGGYSFNARNKVLFGTWEVDDYNMMYLSFPPHLVTYFSFKLLGVGLAQQNLVPVLFSMGSLLLFFLILRRRFSYAWAFGGTGLLGINYLFLMYSRVANRVMPPLFFILLGIYFLQKGTRKAGFFLAAGTSFFLALASKSVVFYVLAGIGIGYLAYILLHHKIKEIASQIALLTVGVLGPGIPWFLFIYIPHQDFIRSFSRLNVRYLIPPADFSSLVRHFWTRPPILMSHMPVICILAALASLLLLLKIVQEKKSIPLVDWIFLFWFLTGYLYYAVIQQRVPRHVIPQIIPLIFFSVSIAHHLLSRPLLERKKIPYAFILILFLWLLFPISLVLKHLTHRFPQLFSGQNSLNTTLLVLSSVFAVFLFILVKKESNRKNTVLPPFWKKALVFILTAGILIFHGTHYLQWAFHPSFQFREISRDLGRAFPEATIAGLWAPVISLENKHRAHEYFPGAINDYPDFFQRFGITHVFTTTHAGENQKFEINFPSIMVRAKLLARYHIWRVEALLYEMDGKPTPEGRRCYEAELFSQRGNMPRFDPDASETFAVQNLGKRSQFVVSIPGRNPLTQGSYSITFRMKKNKTSPNQKQRMARIDAVLETKKKVLAYKDIYPDDLFSTSYRNVGLTFRLTSLENVTFRVFAQGNGGFWLDRIDIHKID